VAVYVTFDPWQDGFTDAAMETLTGRIGFTVIWISLEVAGFPVVQVRLEVSTHFTKSPDVGI